VYVKSIIPMGKCKLIAEIGLTHEGSLGFAFKFIESAKIAGADIVKFQFHLPEFESSKDEEFRVNFSAQDKTRWEYWERTSFLRSEWIKIIEKCNKEAIEFCVSVFSGAAAHEMIDLGVKNIKLGSGDLTNSEIHEVLTKWDGNLFISTGMAYYEEIESCIELLREHFDENRLTVFQCTSKYPTPLNEVGINVMKEIREKWNVKVGLSDHSVGIDSAKVAICFGASIIEKHVVFNKKMFGPDVSSSITFEELQQLSSFRDNFLSIMEKVDKNRIAEQLENERRIFGRSLGLIRAFRKGEILNEGDFCFRKPAGGLSWGDRKTLIGRKLNKDVELGEIIQIEYFD
jgi:N,N'-diacetyllegionaminate synthase